MTKETKPLIDAKKETYERLLKQMDSVLAGERDLTARQANFCAVLKESFSWFWVGFYNVDGSELVLGPFQGPLACFRIAHGKGVCGTAWKEQKTLIVPDVNRFEGHIACSPHTKSEIVVPVFNRHHKVASVLDIDSTEYQQFDTTDAIYLEQLCKLVYAHE